MTITMRSEMQLHKIERNERLLVRGCAKETWKKNQTIRNKRFPIQSIVSIHAFDLFNNSFRLQLNIINCVSRINDTMSFVHSVSAAGVMFKYTKSTESQSKKMKRKT